MRVVGVVLVALLVCGVMCDEEEEHHDSTAEHHDSTAEHHDSTAEHHDSTAGHHDDTPMHEDHYKEGEHDEKYDHEAVLGSEDEAEEYSKLAPEVAKERLAELFVKMDNNNDGSVDVPELVQWILHSFTKLNMEDTRKKLTTDDKNADGFVTWEEFTHSTYGMSESELKDYREKDVADLEERKRMEKSLVYDKQKFAAADENKDGKLDLSEAAAFLHPYDHPRMGKVETQRVLDDYDINKDGKIDMEEYLKNPTFKDRSEEDKVGEQENFKHNDKNEDGSLDADEILKWVSPDLDRIATDEANHLMTETDKNKDGHISVAEIKDQHELWVGSEATDYGDMLGHDEL